MKSTDIAKSEEALKDAQMAAALAPFGVMLSGALAEQIRTYVRLLLRWNERTNLTRIRGPLEILRRHFGEGFFAVRAVPIHGGRLADVGSGAGFPGLPIKLLVPELELTLLERSHKKCAFLGEVCRLLILKNVSVEPTGFERWAYQSGFLDYVTARAVGEFEDLLDWAGQQLSPDGKLILWVGAKQVENIIRKFHWNWREAIKLPASTNRFLLVGTK